MNYFTHLHEVVNHGSQIQLQGGENSNYITLFWKGLECKLSRGYVFVKGQMQKVFLLTLYMFEGY